MNMHMYEGMHVRVSVPLCAVCFHLFTLVPYATCDSCMCMYTISVICRFPVVPPALLGSQIVVLLEDDVVHNIQQFVPGFRLTFV